MKKHSDLWTILYPDLKKLSLKLKAIILIIGFSSLQLLAITELPEGNGKSSTGIKIQPGFEPVQSIVTGRIVDATTREGMPGVNIVVKGTSSGTMSDSNGQYSLTAPPQGSVIVYSFIGYSSVERTFTGQPIINVELSGEVSALEEVVVVGYGTQKKVNLTGSVATASVEKLENRPITNVSQALQGMNGSLCQPGRWSAR